LRGTGETKECEAPQPRKKGAGNQRGESARRPVRGAETSTGGQKFPRFVAGRHKAEKDEKGFSQTQFLNSIRVSRTREFQAPVGPVKKKLNKDLVGEKS